MRRLRYNVAMSLDGFIAGPRGEYDWIVMDPTIDFGALFREFDTLVMGRKTYETLKAQGPDGPAAGMKLFVVSSTLRQSDHPDVTILMDGFREYVAQLKSQSGKDIWLFGGGQLFRALLDAGLVDALEVAIMPVVLGDGIPLLPPGKRISDLRLTSSRALPTGIVMLTYATRR